MKMADVLVRMALLALVALAGSASAGRAGDLSVPDVVAQVRDSVARVLAPDGSVGSAFLIDNKRHLLTNCHVASDHDGKVFDVVNVQFVTLESPPLPAKVLGCDQPSDLAVLEFDQSGTVLVRAAGGRFPSPIPAATFSEIEVGEPVFAVGYALNIKGAPSVTQGVVSGISRSLGWFSDLIQTDASINHGNSGGPLIDSRGRFVGVNTFTNRAMIPKGTDLATLGKAAIPLETPYGIFYARSVGTAVPFAAELIDKGHVPRADLGLRRFAGLSDDESARLFALPKGGALILEFTPDSPLQAAGLREMDVITGIATCSGPGDQMTNCDPTTATIDDIGSLYNDLAFAANSKELILQALRPPQCALEAFKASAKLPAQCMPGKEFLQAIRVRTRTSSTTP